MNRLSAVNPVLITLSLINGLFIYKYGARIIPQAVIPAVIFCVLFPIVICYLHHRFRNRFTSQKLNIILFIYLIVSVIILIGIPIEGLNVDRWSVIDSFWQAMFNGEFPYAARSIHDNPPGPLPVYFLLALPFHLTGEVGLLSLAGILGFYFFGGLEKKDNNSKILVLLCLLLSPSIWWEIATRSTLCFNMTIIIIYLSWAEQQYRSQKNSLLAGFIGGLILSTRAITAVPLLAFLTFQYLRQRDLHTFIIQGAMIIFGFAVTIIPLVIWDLSLFMKFNPITLQAGFLNLPLLLSVFAITILVFFKTQNKTQFYQRLGIIMFLIVLVAMIKEIIISGWSQAVFGNAFDISYFILAIPFLVRGIVDMYSSAVVQN